MNIVLWVIQALLAVAFIMAGFMKTFMPVEKLSKNMSWVATSPVGLVRFVGIAELLGGLGLILPEALRILPWLTVAAAVGLAVIMVLAAGLHIRLKENAAVGAPIVLLVLALVIIVGRLTFAPIV